jgi:hypothetical protein
VPSTSYRPACSCTTTPYATSSVVEYAAAALIALLMFVTLTEGVAFGAAT